MEITVIRHVALFLCTTMTLGLSACGQKDDGTQQRKIASLQADLHKAQDRETTLKTEVSQLTQQVTRLQNDFKLYSQKPCEYELDPVEYTIKKPDGVAAIGQPMPGDAMTPPRPPAEKEPGGPPAELADVNNKIRQARRGIKACYQEAAKKNAALQTTEKRVQLVFNVQPSGQVAGVMVSPPVGFGFEACVRTLLVSWHFSKFNGPTQRFRAWMNLRPQ